ncbi:MAG: Lrp/AsnC family transcriptional regulator [Halanaeroarchaeum sp.]
MVTAYILIEAVAGEADRLRDEISALDTVVDAHVVAGDVDLIAKIEVDSPQDVKAVAADTVQSLDGVTSTETYISMD